MMATASRGRMQPLQGCTTVRGMRFTRALWPLGGATV